MTLFMLSGIGKSIETKGEGNDNPQPHGWRSLVGTVHGVVTKRRLVIAKGEGGGNWD